MSNSNGQCPLQKGEFNEKTKKARDRIGSPPMNYGVSHISSFCCSRGPGFRGRRGRPIVSPRYIGVFGNDARCTCARVSARFIDKPSNKPWIYLSSRVTWFRVPINCYEVATPTLYTHPRVEGPKRSIRFFLLFRYKPSPFLYCSILFRWRFDARGVSRTHCRWKM